MFWKKSREKARKPHRKLNIESLENRQMMAAVMFAPVPEPEPLGDGLPALLWQAR